MERALSRWTDVLITINREDFNIAKNKFHAKKVEYIAGVGIDRYKFSDNFTDTEQKRKELGVKNTDIMLLSVGELSVRKNHELVVRTLKKLNNPHLKYFICGEGELRQYLTDLIHQLGLKKQVRLLGYRTDVSDLCRSSDLFVFPSRQEGLPVALMEAIASKTPVVCSRIRGNTDLVQEYLFANDSVESLQNVLKPIVTDRDKLQERTRDAVERNFEGLAAFEIGNVSNNMSNIYKNMHLET
ncbi:MAG: glycosyltransferase family 4 protein [Dorea sp.]|nr:glycosyltransferase family 4 protein [Dorea sp.]